MNERIFTELYKKAWGHFPCPTGEPELEKFAELIIKECLMIVYERQVQAPTDDDGYFKVATDMVSTDIKLHFGVEK